MDFHQINNLLWGGIIMKKWECTVCGYIHEGDAPPDECPECGVGPELFVEVQE